MNKLMIVIGCVMMSAQAMALFSGIYEASSQDGQVRYQIEIKRQGLNQQVLEIRPVKPVVKYVMGEYQVVATTIGGRGTTRDGMESGRLIAIAKGENVPVLSHYSRPLSKRDLLDVLTLNGKTIRFLGSQKPLTSNAFADLKEEGRAFGDRFGNSQYEILEKTRECGYGDFKPSELGNAIALNSIATIQPSTENFRIYLGWTHAGHNQKYFAVGTIGTVSPTTKGVDGRYLSATEFRYRASQLSGNGHDEKAPIVVTEDDFKIASSGIVTYTKKVSGQVTLVCHYKRISR